MNNDFKTTWETYNASWKVENVESKREIFEKCLDENCIYNDPLTCAEGWDALLGYMSAFHEQVPGGHFETHYFLAHNNQSIAKWHMKNADDIVIGEGVSYGKYNDAGKLVSMTGFFENP